MRSVLALRPIDHFVCFCQRRGRASLQTALGPLTPGPTRKITSEKIGNVEKQTHERVKSRYDIVSWH